MPKWRLEQDAPVKGPLGWRASKLRYVGWHKELKTARLEHCPLVEGDWSAESAFEAVKMLAKSWGSFTAVVVVIAND